MAKASAADRSKARAAELFRSVWKEDPRLKRIDADTVEAFAANVATFDMYGAPVFQGAHLYDVLVSRGAPGEAVIDALVVFEELAKRENIAVRQPRGVDHLSADYKKKLIAARAPPPVEKGAGKKQAPRGKLRRNRGALPRRIALVVVAAALGALGALSLPQPALAPAAVAVGAHGMSCALPERSGAVLFCRVDPQSFAKESDAQVRARMVASEAAARAAGYDAVVYLDAGAGPFKPALWGADPVVPKTKAKATFRPPVPTPPKPAPAPAAPKSSPQ